jgi:hypothetical protein
MNFSNENIDALMATFPGCFNEQKRQLLPLILEEWGCP